MTTKIKVTMEEYAGWPVMVCTVANGQEPQIVASLLEKGESAEVYVHSNQQVVVTEVQRH